MKKLIMFVAVLAVSSLPTMAQARKAPVVSEVEQLKLENLQLKMSNMQQQFSQLLAEKQALTAAITKENPGYHWQVNPQTGQEGLMPDAPATKPAAKAAGKK